MYAYFWKQSSRHRRRRRRSSSSTPTTTMNAIYTLKVLAIRSPASADVARRCASIAFFALDSLSCARMLFFHVFVCPISQLDADLSCVCFPTFFFRASALHSVVLFFYLLLFSFLFPIFFSFFSSSFLRSFAYWRWWRRLFGVSHVSQLISGSCSCHSRGRVNTYTHKRAMHMKPPCTNEHYLFIIFWRYVQGGPY